MDEEENPYAKYVTGDSQEENPYTKYVQQPQPTLAEPRRTEEENPFAKYAQQPEEGWLARAQRQPIEERMAEEVKSQPPISPEQRARAEQSGLPISTPDQPPPPQAEGMLATGAREAVHGVGPIMGGAYGAARGFAATPGPLPLKLLGGAAGAIVGSGLGSAAWEGGAKLLGFDDAQQRAANEALNPVSATIGRTAPMLLAASPGALGRTAGERWLSRGAGAAFGAVTEAVPEALQGEFDPRRIAESAATGAVFAKPRGWVERVGGRPDLWHGSATPDAAGGVAQEQPPPMARADESPQPPSGGPLRPQTFEAGEPAPKIGPRQPPPQVFEADPAIKMALAGEPIQPRGETIQIPEHLMPGAVPGAVSEAQQRTAANLPNNQILQVGETPIVGQQPRTFGAREGPFEPRVFQGEEPPAVPRQPPPQVFQGTEEVPLPPREPPPQVTPVTPREAIEGRAPGEDVGTVLRRLRTEAAALREAGAEGRARQYEAAADTIEARGGRPIAGEPTEPITRPTQQQQQEQPISPAQATRQIGDFSIKKVAQGDYRVMRGNEEVSQHANMGQAYMAMNRAAKAVGQLTPEAPATMRPRVTPVKAPPEAPARPPPRPQVTPVEAAPAAEAPAPRPQVTPVEAPPVEAKAPPPPQVTPVPPSTGIGGAAGAAGARPPGAGAGGAGGAGAGGGGGPAPLGGTPRPVPPARPVAPPEGIGAKWVRRYKETFQPETISPGALRAEPLFAKRKASYQGERDVIQKEGERRYAMWEGVPEQERLDFLDDFENNRPAKPGFQQAAKVYGGQMHEAYLNEAEYGSKKDYVDNYMQHDWEPPQKGQMPINEYLKSRPNFEKSRTIDLIKEGIAAGYKLKDSNPETIVRNRLMAGADMRTKVELLRGLDDMGMAARVKDLGPNAAAAMPRQGWQEVNAPNGDQYLLSPEVQPLWRNAEGMKDLWQSQSAGGDLFRAWQAYKSATLPIKLGLSGFHVLHVAHINANTNFARAVWQLQRGDYKGAMESFTHANPFETAKGKYAQAQWLLGDAARSPEGKAAVQAMQEGGFVPMRPEQSRPTIANTLVKAWADGNYLGVPYQGIKWLAANNPIQKVIFDQWIPRLKTTAYLNDVADALHRDPSLANDPEKRGIAFRAIAKQNDDRFGEMFYNALFMNPKVKNMGIGSFLSLGWNLGFARQAGGAAMEAISRPAAMLAPGKFAPSVERQIVRDNTNKITNALLYWGTGALIAGAMTKAFTGENPEGTPGVSPDYIFPRVGGTNPDGSPRRLTTMFYNREVPMLAKHAQEYGGGFGGLGMGTMAMIWNKMMFQPITELYNNRDYFGREIMDTNAPGWKQAMQAIESLGASQLLPMSTTGAQRVEETGGRPAEKYLSYAGFGPAPGYAEKSAIQNRIAHLYQNYVAPGAKPYEAEEVTRGRQVARNQLLMAKQRGDPEEIAAAQKRASDVGLSEKYQESLGKVSGDQIMFRRLPYQHQLSLLEQATPEERQRYWPWTTSKARVEWNKAHPVREEATPRVAVNEDGYIRTTPIAEEKQIADPKERQLQQIYQKAFNSVYPADKKLHPELTDAARAAGSAAVAAELRRRGTQNFQEGGPVGRADVFPRTREYKNTAMERLDIPSLPDALATQYEPDPPTLGVRQIVPPLNPWPAGYERPAGGQMYPDYPESIPRQHIPLKGG